MRALCAFAHCCHRPSGGGSLRRGAMCPHSPWNGSGAPCAPPHSPNHHGHPPPPAFTQTQLSLLSLVNEHSSVVASSIRYMDKRVVSYHLVVVHIPLHPLLHFVQIFFIIFSRYSAPDVSCLSFCVLAVWYSTNHSIQLLTSIPGIDR